MYLPCKRTVLYIFGENVRSKSNKSLDSRSYCLLLSMLQGSPRMVAPLIKFLKKCNRYDFYRIVIYHRIISMICRQCPSSPWYFACVYFFGSNNLYYSLFTTYWMDELSDFTFDPVHAATISWIVHGVTITMKPSDIAAIVRDTEPLKSFACVLNSFS